MSDLRQVECTIPSPKKLFIKEGCFRGPRQTKVEVKNGRRFEGTTNGGDIVSGNGEAGRNFNKKFSSEFSIQCHSENLRTSCEFHLM